MSEKLQHTATRLREQMENRYGDALHHKHNKFHLLYRQHCRSHPIQIHNGPIEDHQVNTSTGFLRALKLQKVRKRLDKGRIH